MSSHEQTVAKYMIPDKLKLNNVTSSQNEWIAYTKLTAKEHIQGMLASYWFFPLPANLNCNTDYKWDAEETSHVATGSVNAVKNAINGNFAAAGFNALEVFAGLGGAALKNGVKNLLSKTKVSAVADQIFGAGATGKAVDDVTKFAGKTMGIAYNPNEQLYFKGVNLREFDMEFRVSPTTIQEAVKIRSAIHDILKAASPDLSEVRYFFDYPSLFDLDIVVNGVNIIHREDLAITGFNSSLGEQGMTWHKDSFPTTITFNITFKESVIVTRKDIGSSFKLLEG